MEFFIFIKNIPTHMQMICKTVKLKYFDPYLVITQSLLLQDIVRDKTVGNWYRHLIDMSAEVIHYLCLYLVIRSQWCHNCAAANKITLHNIWDVLSRASTAITDLPSSRHDTAACCLVTGYLQSRVLQFGIDAHAHTYKIFRFPCWKTLSETSV